MSARLVRGLSLPRLRLLLALLFVALAIPSAVLLVHSRSQLKWESFHHYRGQAEELSARIDADLRDWLAIEEARAYGDYAFLVTAGDPTLSNLVQRSPLSAYPLNAQLPGVLGYFQVDADGRFSSPLLPPAATGPEAFGIAPAELDQRQALQQQLFDILSSNRLADASAIPEPVPDSRESDDRDAQAVDATTGREHAASDLERAASPGSSPRAAESTASKGGRDDPSGIAEEAMAQKAFDALSEPQAQQLRAARNELGRLDQLKLGKTYQAEDADQPQFNNDKKRDVPSRAPRKEQSATYADVQRQAISGADNTARIRTFESEVDPLEFSLLDERHAVLYRKVWRDGQRTIQGAILSTPTFFDAAFIQPFRSSGMAPVTDLLIAYQGEVLTVARGGGDGYVLSSAESLRGELLQQTRLSAPFGNVQLLFAVRELPLGPGSAVVLWSSLVLFMVLVLGFIALYRLGARQIRLALQQQDFVSAVSHELKTPLTSIRMYAEMLQEGWVGEAKRAEYHGYILGESERLSRLIANVLQLARLERQGLELQITAMPVATVMDILHSKLQQLAERAGFEIHYRNGLDADARVAIDPDALTQIMLNLVENAIKFAAAAERREIDIVAEAQGNRQVCFSVRDFGPGIERSQLKKIFQLFYRPGSELTRETIGTGIGLALVRQLARAMQGEADAINRNPGAEFRVLLPRIDDAA